MKKVEWLLVFGPNGFGWPMRSVANDACEFYFRAGIVILSLHGIAITVNNLDQSIYKKEITFIFMVHTPQCPQCKKWWSQIDWRNSLSKNWWQCESFPIFQWSDQKTSTRVDSVQMNGHKMMHLRKLCKLRDFCSNASMYCSIIQ